MERLKFQRMGGRIGIIIKEIEMGNMSSFYLMQTLLIIMNLPHALKNHKFSWVNVLAIGFCSGLMFMKYVNYIKG